MKILSKRELLALNPDERKDYNDRLAAAELRAEQARVDAMSDAEVLSVTNNGTYGAGLVGKPLAERAAKVKLETGDGQFGPAITDPDYATKLAAQRAAGRRSVDEPVAMAKAFIEGKLPAEDRREDAGSGEELDPWRATSLSGAKLLAQAAGVSHKPGIKKQDLIDKLKAAGVVPPPVPSDEGDDEGDDA